MNPLRWIDDELAVLEGERLLRTRPRPIAGPGPRLRLDGRSILNLSSNDYLGLAGERVSWDGPRGASASRLICGELDAHRSLEREIAEWLGEEDALLFSSGYAANAGALSALSREGSLVVSDALNHASIIDGCRLGKGRVLVVPHRDLRAVERALASGPELQKLVVTEGYFSMDGDLAPLAELRQLCDRNGAALYVDEAHALGVWGPSGRGASAAAGVRPDVLMGTLGKSIGAGGAFVAGSAQLIRWTWNRARSFVFSTGLVPVAAELARQGLGELRQGHRTAALQRNAAIFRAALFELGVRTIQESEGPIVPIILGTPDRAISASSRLFERGILAQPIRPPTVPRETARLRLAVQAGHTTEELTEAARAIAEVVR